MESGLVVSLKQWKYLKDGSMLKIQNCALDVFMRVIQVKVAFMLGYVDYMATKKFIIDCCTNKQ